MDETLTFTLKLKFPEGAKHIYSIAAGGADADHDGTVEDASEVAAFSPGAGNVFTRTQTVQQSTAGMLFVVTFTVGVGVAWALDITNSAGKVLYHGANTTVLASEVVSYWL